MSIMKKKGFARKAATVVLAVGVLLSLSAPALAASEPVAESLDGSVEYYSCKSAWQAAYTQNVAIVMLRDWNISSRLILPEDKSATIYMNGHTISRSLTSSASTGEVICMEENSKLTLSGRDKNLNLVDAEFTYNGWMCSPDGSGGQEWSQKEATTKNSGGLITGGWGIYDGGGVNMEEKSQLTLDHVALAGNRCEENIMGSYGLGGGVYMEADECRLTMQNGALIEHNGADRGGGGVYLEGENCVISMTDAREESKAYELGSKIQYNYVEESGLGGGGIYVCNDDFTLSMKEHSGIDYNYAPSGGGVYVGTDYSNIKITSDDNTGTMSYNTAFKDNGGGIEIKDAPFESNYCEIKGITFEGNTAQEGGGGVHLMQENTTVKSCHFTGNRVLIETKQTDRGYGGGGIAVHNDKITISDCVVTGNEAPFGGGIFCGQLYNVILDGTLTVKDNTRHYGIADDLYLQSIMFNAYFIGSPNADSEIGICVENYDEKRVGKNGTFYAGYFFSDNGGYRPEVRENGTEVYLVKGSSYRVTVNGEYKGYYTQGERVTIDGTAPSGSVFKTWNWAEDVDYTNPKNAVTTFKMPDHAVNVTASYFSEINEVTLTVPEVKAGKSFQQNGWLTRPGYNAAMRVKLIWLEKPGDTTQTVTGKAGYGKSYFVAAVIPRSVDDELAFSSSMNGSSVKIKYGDNPETQAYYAYVDYTGALTVYSDMLPATAKPDITEVTPQTVKVTEGVSRGNLVSALPQTTTVTVEDGKTYTVATDVEKATYSDGLKGNTITQSGTVTIPLKITENDSVTNTESLSFTVNVNVEKKVITPVPGAGTPETTYNSLSKEIVLTAEAGTTIHYKIDGGTEVTYSGPFEITGTKGEKKTVTITAWTSAEGKTASPEVTFEYVLDNPLTVTLKGRDTAGKTFGEEKNFPKKFEYYKDDEITIGAPKVTGEVFASWEDVPDTAEKDGSLFTLKLTDEITVTAVYNPVVTEINIGMAVPTVGEALTKKIESATVKADELYNATDNFGEIEWSSEDACAGYNTEYIAKIAMTAGGGKTFALDEGVKVTLNGETTGFTAYVAREDGKNVIYITFPAIEKPKDPEKPIEPDPEDPDEPVNPDITPYVPVPTPVTPVTPATPDEGTVTVDYGECKGDSTCPIAAFTDADPKAWYHDGMHYCLAEGLINGVGNDKLSSEGKVTRGQIVTILWRLAGKPASRGTAAFSDIGDTWYTEAVRWATENSIVTGYGNGKFGPDDYVTREQLAAILYRYSLYKGMTAVTLSENLTGYPDCDDVSTYAVSAMEWAVGSGIISGTEKGTLAPNATATRGETAVMLQRFCTSI